MLHSPQLQLHQLQRWRPILPVTWLNSTSLNFLEFPWISLNFVEFRWISLNSRRPDETRSHPFAPNWFGIDFLLEFRIFGRIWLVPWRSLGRWLICIAADSLAWDAGKIHKQSFQYHHYLPHNKKHQSKRNFPNNNLSIQNRLKRERFIQFLPARWRHSHPIIQIIPIFSNLSNYSNQPGEFSTWYGSASTAIWLEYINIIDWYYSVGHWFNEFLFPFSSSSSSSSRSSWSFVVFFPPPLPRARINNCSLPPTRSRKPPNFKAPANPPRNKTKSTPCSCSHSCCCCQ